MLRHAAPIICHIPAPRQIHQSLQRHHRLRMPETHYRPRPSVTPLRGSLQRRDKLPKQTTRHQRRSLAEPIGRISQIMLQIPALPQTLILPLREIPPPVSAHTHRQRISLIIHRHHTRHQLIQAPRHTQSLTLRQPALRHPLRRPLTRQSIRQSRLHHTPRLRHTPPSKLPAQPLHKPHAPHVKTQRHSRRTHTVTEPLQHTPPLPGPAISQISRIHIKRTQQSIKPPPAARTQLHTPRTPHHTMRHLIHAHHTARHIRRKAPHTVIHPQQPGIPHREPIPDTRLLHTPQRIQRAPPLTRHRIHSPAQHRKPPPHKRQLPTAPQKIRQRSHRPVRRQKPRPMPPHMIHEHHRQRIRHRPPIRSPHRIPRSPIRQSRPRKHTRQIRPRTHTSTHPITPTRPTRPIQATSPTSSRPKSRNTKHHAAQNTDSQQSAKQTPHTK